VVCKLNEQLPSAHQADTPVSGGDAKLDVFCAAIDLALSGQHTEYEARLPGGQLAKYKAKDAIQTVSYIAVLQPMAGSTHFCSLVMLVMR
jgi:hypothetical protein